MKENPKTLKTLNVYLPLELKEKIRYLAYKLHKSQSQIVVQILSKHIDKLMSKEEQVAKMEREEDYGPDTLFEVGLLEKHIHTLENK